MKKVYVTLMIVSAIVLFSAMRALAQGASPVVPASDLTNVILFIVGMVVSTIFSYFPAVKIWYGNQQNNGWIMFVVTAIVSGAYFWLSCSPLAAQLNIQTSCTQLGAVTVFWGFVNCVIGNQLTYLTTGSAPVATVPAAPKPAG